MDGNPVEEAKIPETYTEHKSEVAFDGKLPRNEMREMPTKAEEAEALAERLGVTLEELPDRLMEMKMSMEQKVKEVQRFTEQFKTLPKNRAMRRAQRFGHTQLHYGRGK